MKHLSIRWRETPPVLSIRKHCDKATVGHQAVHTVESLKSEKGERTYRVTSSVAPPTSAARPAPSEAGFLAQVANSSAWPWFWAAVDYTPTGPTDANVGKLWRKSGLPAVAGSPCDRTVVLADPAGSTSRSRNGHRGRCASIQ